MFSMIYILLENRLKVFWNLFSLYFQSLDSFVANHDLCANLCDYANCITTVFLAGPYSITSAAASACPRDQDTSAVS